jgi:hypothetical protein
MDIDELMHMSDGWLRDHWIGHWLGVSAFYETRRLGELRSRVLPFPYHDNATHQRCRANLTDRNWITALEAVRCLVEIHGLRMGATRRP